MSEINKNMLRERADKLPEVTDDKWEEINKEHKLLVNEYLEYNAHLSPKTIIQYTSGLRHFFWWIHEVLDDKPIYKITKRDFNRYLSFLRNHGMSSSGLGFKKSSVSALNNYIENVIVDEGEDENYKNFRNFTKGLPPIPKNQVYDKVKITKEEYELMISTLTEDKNYLGTAWVATAFNVGARREEIRQFKTEILNYDIPEGQNYILSHHVRGKGSGIDGKNLVYMVNLEALKYIKLWVDKRGYEHEYIFTLKNEKRISESWADNFCSDILSDIVQRRINPHLFKASCITNLLEQGVDVALVSKYIAQHNNISTTLNFYDLRDFEEERNKIFDGLN